MCPARVRAVPVLRDPEKTATAWRPTGAGQAFTVGDVGRLDDDGYLYLDGRREDLIISGGVNVYPAEVEAIISALPGVIDIVVYPRPDPHWGQRGRGRRSRRRHRNRPDELVR